MKKILLSTIILTAFALSITLFEISCKKTANAQSAPYVLPAATTTKLGGVIPDGITISVDGNGKISAAGSAMQQQDKILYLGADGLIWTANYDGSSQQKLNINYPSNVLVAPNLSISPDRKTIFFELYTKTGGDLPEYIYSCNVDGSNLKKIISTGGYVSMGVAY